MLNGGRFASRIHFGRIWFQYFWSAVGMSLIEVHPKTALACQACFAVNVRVMSPYVIVVYPVFFLWIICLWRERCNFSPSRADTKASDFPGGRAFAFWVMAGVFDLALVPFAFLYPAAQLLLYAWVSFLAVSIVFDAVLRIARYRRSPGSIVATRLNLLAVIVLCAGIPFYQNWGTRPAALVANLGCSSAHKTVDEFLINSLLEAGPPVKPLIINAVKNRDAPPLNGSFQHEGLSRACFLLAKFGGNDAEQSLHDVVARDFPVESSDDDWERLGVSSVISACCYAEIGGSRAANLLRELYSKANRSEFTKAVILCAMARTKTREGILFVIDHDESFGILLDENARKAIERDRPVDGRLLTFSTMNQNTIADDGDVRMGIKRFAVMTLTALSEGPQKGGMPEIPYYHLTHRNRIPWIGFDERHLHVNPARSVELPDPGSTLENWHSNHDSIRMYWEKTFAGDETPEA